MGRQRKFILTLGDCESQEWVGSRRGQANDDNSHMIGA